MDSRAETHCRHLAGGTVEKKNFQKRKMPVLVLFQMVAAFLIHCTIFNSKYYFSIAGCFQTWFLSVVINKPVSTVIMVSSTTGWKSPVEDAARWQFAFVQKISPWARWGRVFSEATADSILGFVERICRCGEGKNSVEQREHFRCDPFQWRIFFLVGPVSPHFLGQAELFQGRLYHPYEHAQKGNHFLRLTSHQAQ